MSNKINYVEHGGPLSFPAPVVCEGGFFYNFLLEGKKENLIAICDRYFNNPSGGEAMYYPLTHMMMVTMGSIPKIFSSTVNIGYSPEKQMIIWLVLARVKKVGPVLVAQYPVLFPVYTVVPDIYSLISGREVFGFFKSYGWVDVPKDPNLVNPEKIALDVFGLKEFGPDQEAQRWPLMQFDIVDKGVEPSTWTSVKDLFKAMRPHLFPHGDSVVFPGFHFPISLLDDLMHHEIPLVFLKQFRDVTADNQAAYQAIVESPCPFKNLHAEKMESYDFSIVNDLASYPLAQDLGLEDQKAVLGVKIKMDFQIGAGKIIWEATKSSIESEETDHKQKAKKENHE